MFGGDIFALQWNFSLRKAEAAVSVKGAGN
jgi:hypothetical protein